MRIRKPILVFLIVLTTLVIASSAVFTLLLRRDPEFYRAAGQQPGEARQQAAKRLLAQSAQIASDMKQLSRWQGTLSAADVNAWLAEEFPRLAQQPADQTAVWMLEPRIAFEEGRLLVGVREARFGLDCVIWLQADVWVPEPGKLAVRFQHVGLGALPGPVAKLTELVDAAARHLQCPLQWKQRDGDPVAILDLTSRATFAGLERIDLQPGRAHASGTGRARAERAARRSRHAQ